MIFFETRLDRHGFALGNGPQNTDSDRAGTDTILIHHTSNPPGLSPTRLSAIELIRLYGPYFANPPEKDRALRGKPLFSGHVRNSQQVFWPYHWLIRNDGRMERLLRDREIGWHAGDWETNCRSIAIAFDDDLEFWRPAPQALAAAAALIAHRYRHVPISNIIGHSEVRGRTVCPSALFLDNDAGPGWKRDLADTISKLRMNIL